MLKSLNNTCTGIALFQKVKLKAKDLWLYYFLEPSWTVEDARIFPQDYSMDPISQMRAFLAACRELVMDYDTFPKQLYVLDIKRNKS